MQYIRHNAVILLLLKPFGKSNFMENSTNDTKNKELSADSLLLLLWKWRRTVLIIVGLALVSSVAISLTIREKFKSTAIVFPANASSVTLGE
jgi:LPS O-antigen subunit length determinant protein (WzzB/FepE family)